MPFAPSTVCNAEEFSRLFGDFWSKQVHDIFPVELVAMDYVLTKWAPTALEPRRDPGDEAAALAQVLAEAPSDQAFGRNAGVEYRTGSFEGLLIGVFYASLTSDHPTGVVPMTNYGDLMEGVDEVRALHSMSRPVLSIDYSKFGVSGRDRSWRNVLAQGVKAFRARLEQLAKASIVTLSLDDLLAIATDGSCDVLTVHSRYNRRRLPIAGMFVDVPSEKRTATATRWARQLLNGAVSEVLHNDGEPQYQETLTDLTRGRELADKLWEAYCNKDMMDKRELLSSTVRELKAGRRTVDSLVGEENQAITTFDVDLGKELLGGGRSECRANFLDIRHPDYTARQKRWAALMIILRVVHRRWAAAESWTEYAASQNWNGAGEGLLHDVDRDDVYLALFPWAKGPVVLPWHIGEEPESRWQTLKSLSSNDGEGLSGSDTASKGTRFGNLALSVPDVLNGRDWTDNPSVPTGSGYHGFRHGERIIMQWYAESLDERDDWRSDRQMLRILSPERTTSRGPT